MIFLKKKHFFSQEYDKKNKFLQKLKQKRCYLVEKVIDFRLTPKQVRFDQFFII